LSVTLRGAAASMDTLRTVLAAVGLLGAQDKQKETYRAIIEGAALMFSHGKQARSQLLAKVLIFCI
jgi:hypothetical protein